MRCIRSRFATPLLLGLAIAGCAATTNVSPPPSPALVKVTARSVSPSLVKLFMGQAPRPPRLVFGAVKVDVHGDALQAAGALRKVAGKMGADAVVQVKYSKPPADISRTSLSGLAVRFAP